MSDKEWENFLKNPFLTRCSQLQSTTIQIQGKAYEYAKKAIACQRKPACAGW